MPFPTSNLPWPTLFLDLLPQTYNFLKFIHWAKGPPLPNVG